MSDLKARELDVRIAKRIFGYKVELMETKGHEHHHGKKDYQTCSHPYELLKAPWAATYWTIPNYSTDLAMALQVVDAVSRVEGRMRSCFPFILMEDRYGGVYSGGRWIASFGVDPGYLEGSLEGDSDVASYWMDVKEHDDPIACADNPAMAICLAALKVIGVEVNHE